MITSLHRSTQIRFIQDSCLVQSELTGQKTEKLVHTSVFDTKRGVVHMPQGGWCIWVFDVKTEPHDCARGRRKPYAPPHPKQGGGAYGFRGRTEVYIRFLHRLDLRKVEPAPSMRHKTVSRSHTTDLSSAIRRLWAIIADSDE